MFQTHYAKQRPRERYVEDKGPLLTPMESLLYDLAPFDILFTKEYLTNAYQGKLKAKPAEYKFWKTDSVSVSRLIDSLARQGFLKEIHGIRIAKLISSF